MISGGLGAEYKTDPTTGQVIDCDSWSNLFQGVCWNPTAATVVPATVLDQSGNPVGVGGAIATSSNSLFGVPSWIWYVGIGVVAVVLFKR